MSYKLYVNYLCPYVQRTLIIAVYKDIQDLDFVDISLTNMPDWYKQLNNRWTVPALQLPDGKIYPESYLICQYFDDHFEPKNQLLPIEAEARNAIQDFVDKSASSTLNFMQLLMSDGKEQIDIHAAVKKELAHVSAMMDEIGPFVMGSTFTMADVAYAPFAIRIYFFFQAYLGINLFEECPRFYRFIKACRTVSAFANTCLPAHQYIEHFRKFTNGKQPKWEFTLYIADGCPFCARVGLTLGQALAASRNYESVDPDARPAGIRFKEEKIDLGNVPDWFVKLNPDETVPVLVTPEGNVLTQSMSILQYISDIFPEAKLMPVTDEWTLKGRIMVDLIGTMFGGLYNDIHEKRNRRTEGEIDGDAMWAIEELEKLLTDRENITEGGSYLCGKRATIFDFAIMPMLSMAEHVYSADRLFKKAPHVNQFLEVSRADLLFKTYLVRQEDFLASKKLP